MGLILKSAFAPTWTPLCFSPPAHLCAAHPRWIMYPITGLGSSGTTTIKCHALQTSVAHFYLTFYFSQSTVIIIIQHSNSHFDKDGKHLPHARRCLKLLTNIFSSFVPYFILQGGSYYKPIFISFFLAVPCSVWDLSSWTKD